MATVYLGLGSNLGDRRAHLAHGLRRLDEEYGLTGVSSVWETDPVGYEDQPRFLNLVARVETEAGPRAVLETARAIEEERGREPTGEKNGPRTLDIDLLLHGDVVMDEEGLVVPHPRMVERAFVVAPLLELDTMLEDPRTGRRIAGMEAAAPSEREGMEVVMAGEELLHEDDA